MSADLATPLRQWFRAHARDLPWRRPPHSSDPYAIMVSEFMLQQTQVATVIPYFQRWMEAFPTVASLAAAPEQEILRHWQGLGYYTRARNLHRAAHLLLHGFPDTLAEMKKLPGMGDYTAGAILTFAFDTRVPIVDANIARVLARLHNLLEPIDTTAGQKKIWSLAAQSLPKTHPGEYNAALMELGALICTPRPHCDECPVRPFCLATDPASLPLKTPKTATTAKTELAIFAERDGRIALVQREKNPWLGLWTLPEKTDPPDILEMPLHTHRYGITRYRVTLEIYRGFPTGEVRWCDRREIAALPMPAPHRKVLDTLL